MARSLLCSVRMKAGLLGVLLLTGCVPTVKDVAQARAATDLNCPPNQVVVSEEGGGVLKARGCHASTQYVCFYVHYTGTICLTDAPARVVPDTSVEPTRVPRVPQHTEGVGKHGNLCIDGSGASVGRNSCPD